MNIRTFLQAKIHRGTLTGANLDYEGSISVCPELLSASNILPFQQVDVYNLENGERFTTYIIKGEEGEIRLNGAAAHKGKKGHKVIIAAYVGLSQDSYASHMPVLVFVDKNNKVREITNG
ncbi:aspartate 1-decarboxylase [Desulfonatronovibrio magnus]|uniref:aspartate 1-decarboxylase n=1 Tax=Desulfonatronovibrio magnus TaxID=698827 RepID=UPI0005EBA1BB|nr:aspartate 1-decarboxylase [Desulfonatronovibrio magnus]